MDLVVLGVSHRTAPLEVRERLDFSKVPPDEYLPKLTGRPSVRSAMVLSTCNRVEVYAAGSGEKELLRDAGAFLRDFHGCDEAELTAFIYTRTNRDAVRHLFRVASSLESLVVGEPQILGQVKEAYFDASARTPSDPFFDRLFRKAFSVAKRIRSETKIAEEAVSVSYAAVELAGKIFGDLRTKSVMILGAGEMAELAARHLKRHEVREMIFTNRSYEHSAELAKEHGGTSVPLGDFARHLSGADIVIVSTAAPGFLIMRDHLDCALRERRQEPMLVIDISVPRNVDPAANGLENVYLYNIDDLEGIVNVNLQTRAAEAEKAAAIVEGEVDRFYDAMDKLRAAPVIRRIQEKYEDARAQEMERLGKRLAHLPKEELEEIDRAMSSMTKKMLNDPILFLNEKHPEKDLASRLALFLRIFGFKEGDD